MSRELYFRVACFFIIQIFLLNDMALKHVFAKESVKVRQSSVKAKTQVNNSLQSIAVNPNQVLVQPYDINYLGAFRLPGGEERPKTFAYGGNAMTFNPNGDPNGGVDGFPGSLFISGHNRMPYGVLPNGGQIAEVNIPAPSLSRSVAELPQAQFLQNFQDVLAGHFTAMQEIPRMGLLYLNNPLTGAKIHVAYGQHFEPDPPSPTHGWFSPNLASPNVQGEWFLRGQSFYSVTDYLFEIPSDWAEASTQGRVIATGRFRDGGWSGMGPAIIAYRPWDSNGNPNPTLLLTLMSISISTHPNGRWPRLVRVISAATASVM